MYTKFDKEIENQIDTLLAMQVMQKKDVKIMVRIISNRLERNLETLLHGLKIGNITFDEFVEKHVNDSGVINHYAKPNLYKEENYDTRKTNTK